MKKIFSILFLIIMSFVLVLLCASRTSPLYSILVGDMMNNQASYTMLAASSFTKGMIPFKDYFIVSTPLYLLINMIGYLFANRLGVFILEFISLSLYCFITYKLLLHYVSNIKAIILTIFSLIPIGIMMSGGNSAIEFTLPFNALLLYITLKPKEVNSIDSFLMGICISIILLLEPLALGISLGIIVYSFLKHSSFKHTLLSLVGFIVPIILVSVFYVVYGSNLGELKRMIIDYFYLIKSNGFSTTLLFHKLIKNAMYLPLLISGLILTKKQKQLSIKLVITSICGITIGMLNDNSWYFFMVGITTLPISIAITLTYLNNKTLKGLSLLLQCIIVIVLSGLCLNNIKQFIYYDNKKVNEELAQKVDDYKQTVSDQIIWYNCDCSIQLYLNDQPTTYYFVQQDLLSLVDPLVDQDIQGYLNNDINYTLLISNEKSFYGKNLDSFTLVEGVLRRDYQHYMIYVANEEE